MWIVVLRVARRGEQEALKHIRPRATRARILGAAHASVKPDMPFVLVL